MRSLFAVLAALLGQVACVHTSDNPPAVRAGNEPADRQASVRAKDTSRPASVGTMVMDGKAAAGATR